MASVGGMHKLIEGCNMASVGGMDKSNSERRAAGVAQDRAASHAQTNESNPSAVNLPTCDNDHNWILQLSRAG